MLTDGHVASIVGVGGTPHAIHLLYLVMISLVTFSSHFFATSAGAPRNIPKYFIRVFLVLMSRPSTHSSGRMSDPLSVPTRSPKVLGHELTGPDAFSYMANSARKGVSWSVLRRLRLTVRVRVRVCVPVCVRVSVRVRVRVCAVFVSVCPCLCPVFVVPPLPFDQ